MNRRYQLAIWMGCIIYFPYTGGCSAETNQVVENSPDFPSLVEGDSVSTSTEQGSACPTDNLTRSCTCQVDGQTAPGRQFCSVAFGWSDCECDQIPSTLLSSGESYDELSPSDNKGTARFDWKRSMPTGGVCKAGYHKGKFDGTYNSEALSTLTVGFYSTLPVNGDVEFTILEKPGTKGELFEISDGTFIGTALEEFPFEGEFYGTLDCKTKTFSGGLRHCFYDVAGNKYAFQGVAYSEYDVTTNTFINGVWSVAEPAEGALFNAPILAIDEPYPDDSKFPEPIDVKPGDLIIQQNIFNIPWDYRGGIGNWTGTYVTP